MKWIRNDNSAEYERGEICYNTFVQFRSPCILTEKNLRILYEPIVSALDLPYRSAIGIWKLLNVQYNIKPLKSLIMRSLLRANSNNYVL